MSSICTSPDYYYEQQREAIAKAEAEDNNHANRGLDHRVGDGISELSY